MKSEKRKSKIAEHLVKFGDFGGDKGSRTPDLYDANVSLYQLSYIPIRFGAGGGNRTLDLFITSEPLYRLSYTSICRSIIINYSE